MVKDPNNRERDLLANAITIWSASKAWLATSLTSSALLNWVPSLNHELTDQGIACTRDHFSQTLQDTLPELGRGARSSYFRGTVCAGVLVLASSICVVHNPR